MLSDQQRNMELLAEVANARYEDYLDRSRGVLNTLSADRDVRNFFVEHRILRHYSRQDAKRRLLKLIEANSCVGDIVLHSDDEKFSMMGCKIENRMYLPGFAVSCDKTRTFKRLFATTDSGVRIELLVDLGRFANEELQSLLKTNGSRIILTNRQGRLLAVTGKTLAEGKQWISEQGLSLFEPPMEINRRGEFFTLLLTSGEIGFLSVSPVSNFQAHLAGTIRWANITGLFLILIPGLIALIFSRSLSRRLRELARASRFLGSQQEIPVETIGNDEVAELARAFEEMRLRVNRSTEELEQLVSERTATIEQQKAELIALNNKLKELASYDSLTGLSNRRSFEEQGQNVVAIARRESLWLGIAMIDIDFFKAVNDCYGHRAGDDCLRIIGNTLKDHFRRESDLIGRYGGEEFAIVTSAPGVNKEFGGILEELRQTIAQTPVHSGSVVFNITISCGAVMVVPGRDCSLMNLLDRADKALYMAKKSGRNKIILHDTLMTSMKGV
jgi:diguanylate cyclase (GGDEF)-like protein